MRAVGEAVAALAGDPCPPPPEGFHRGRYHRLRAGEYRIMYVVEEDVITIERVDRRLFRHPDDARGPAPGGAAHSGPLRPEAG